VAYFSPSSSSYYNYYYYYYYYYSSHEVDAVYQDWIKRLQHPHFGLSCLFISQNASQKLGE